MSHSPTGWFPITKALAVHLSLLLGADAIMVLSALQGGFLILLPFDLDWSKAYVSVAHKHVYSLMCILDVYLYVYMYVT